MSGSNTFLSPHESEHPYTISEINKGIACSIESGNTIVWIEGEVSNWKPSSSGHCYFRLKDATSQIPAVMWRSTALELKFLPVDGMAVTAIASIRVYQRGGYYQLDVHKMQPIGQGMFYAAFLKLKSTLEREGLFDPSFKKSLPQSVRRIGVVTSKNGAAIHDIVRVISSRAPQTEIILCDTAVQGDIAPTQIVKAIELLNDYGKVDCIIVGRGGGSAEDLQPFNEEIVARTIFASRIPIISAVGHEVDFTIADFVADIRAATPSAAAELAVGDSEDSSRMFLIISDRFNRAFSRSIVTIDRHYRDVMHQKAFRKPWKLYIEMEQQLDTIELYLKKSLLQIIERYSHRLVFVSKNLAALNPVSVMARGYSIVRNDKGTILRSSDSITPGAKIGIRFSKGMAEGTIEHVYP